MPDRSERRGLSEAQREATCAPDGPLLIVAGPGTGKTRTLAARVAHLVGERGVLPGHILALTFSTRAAHELRQRLTGSPGQRGPGADVITFHAFGLRIVRRWGGLLSLPPGTVRVADTTFAHGLLAEALASLDHPVNADMASLITAIESERLAAEDGATPPLTAAINAYEERLREAGQIDFPGMLTWPLQLFARHPQALDACRSRYRHILVDEAQDICPAQATLLRRLVGGDGNLTIVGDPAQSLYGWRGADGTFLRDFSRHYPPARVARLTENFRSTGRIVAAANALVATLAHGQPLTTANPAGVPVRHITLRDDAEEARFVAAEVRRLLATGAMAHPGEIAVLARANWQLRAVAESLHERGIPATHRDDDVGGDRLHLATIHQARGAEWRAVFVLGWEEGLLPHHRARDSTGLTGERHVAFVAVTRPHERLYLTTCRQRLGAIGGTPRVSPPSRFLEPLLGAARVERDRRAA